MADEFSVQINGLSELQDALNNLPYVLARKAMRNALNAAGDVFLEAAQSTAPVKTGLLKADEIEKAVVGSGLDNNSVRVGPAYDRTNLAVNKKTGKVDTASSPGVYGRFLEFGTSNMPARPWLRPAFAASSQQALRAFVDTLVSGLDDAVREARK